MSGYLTPKDRQHIAEFMAAQSFRTKAFYEGMAGTPDRQEFGRTFAQLWESIFITAREIARRHWALMVIANLLRPALPTHHGSPACRAPSAPAGPDNYILHIFAPCPL
jgi:hypothetical protein